MAVFTAAYNDAGMIVFGIFPITCVMTIVTSLICRRRFDMTWALGMARCARLGKRSVVDIDVTPTTCIVAGVTSGIGINMAI